MDKPTNIYKMSASNAQWTKIHDGPRIQTLHASIIRTTPASIRMKFWGLCVVVILLIVIYGFAYWSMLTETPRTKSRSSDVQWDKFHVDFDFHREDRILGHTGDSDSSFLAVETEKQHARQSNTVALGCAITSRAYQDLTPRNIQVRLPLLRTLIPSFCSTASPGFDYHFYVSFDIDDASLHRSEFLNAIYNHFDNIRNTLCTKTFNVSLHFVQCSHSHNPAWAQNDAMMEAYLDDIEYFYRVNDDTVMLSPGWTETYIEVLQGFNPPNVGVVGPVHKGGNEFILTYDFVQKSHIDIFGYYYPRLFTDWWADDWITAVYGQERTLKLPSVKLKHTQEAGQRYKVQYDNGELVHYQVAHDRRTLNRYIHAVTHQQNSSTIPKRIISMSLWGSDPRYTYGALRNAQLTPIFFPGWTLRIYVEEYRGDKAPRYDIPPQRIKQKLVSLGAEIVYVNTDEISIPPMMWRFLAADDMSLDAFIVRDADARLNDRDAAIVKDWLMSNSSFHCVRDHPSHTQYSLSGGLWGARPKGLYQVIPVPWKQLMMGYRTGYGQDMAFLRNMIWRKVEPIAYCHDSYSCQSWKGSHPFPVKRRGTEHVGQVFDAFGYARDDDMKIIRETPINPECNHENALYSEPDSITDLRAEDEIHSGHLKKLEESIEKRLLHDKMENSLKEQMDDIEFNNTITPKTVSIDVKSYQLLDTSGYQKTGNATNIGSLSQESVVIWSIDTKHFPAQDIKYTLRKVKNIHFILNSYSIDCNETNACAMNNKFPGKEGNITSHIRNVFWKYYRDSPDVLKATHFLCTIPLDICDLYSPFKKPTILVISDRYDKNVSNKLVWDVKLKALASNQKNVIIANSDYHARLLEYNTGIQALVIPPVCSFVNKSYSPRNSDILIHKIQNLSFLELFQGYLKDLLKTKRYDVVINSLHLSTKGEFAEISYYQALIYIPVEMVSYEFCEYYGLSIPIFAPSLKLLLKWHQKYNILNNLKDIPGYDMTDSLWMQSEDASEWLQMADIYQHPFVVHFDSVKDLATKLTSVNLSEISKNMTIYTNRLELQNVDKWSLVLR